MKAAPEGRSGTRRAHIVLAHPEPRSFNGQLAELAGSTLRGQGWEVTSSDLYAMDFDPCERATHYGSLHDSERLDVMALQRFASERDALPNEVQSEIERLDRADLVILQYPVWWHLPPAMLKGWMDRVFAYGEVYSSEKRFEKGRFAGKRALLSVTVATDRETYAYNGRSADIRLLLWPVQFTLAYVGFDILSPFVAYGVRPKAPPRNDLRQVREQLARRLAVIEGEPLVPFNRMSEWGEDGRLQPTAPVYSPFIRHREQLELD